MKIHSFTLWQPTSYLVGTLPDGYIRASPLPQIPIKQSVPATRERVPGYLGLPIGIPTLPSLIGPTIARM
jgi:hypothetical protein